MEKKNSKILQFIKDWMLVIALVFGALLNQYIDRLSFLYPYLLFVLLYLTFCNVTLKEIRFSKMFLVLLLYQLGGSFCIYYILQPINPILAQGMMICLLAPTAVSSTVVTQILGGKLEFMAVYVFLCTIAVAFAAPFFFSIFGFQSDFTFIQSVLRIALKVFPVLILPLVCALLTRKFIPKVHAELVKHPDTTFYLWAFVLFIAFGGSTRTLLKFGSAHLSTDIMLGAASLVLCLVSFAAGKAIGKRFGDPVACGQGLGQKNIILAIWLSQTYLHPLALLAPASYILWQNIFNSVQLMMHSRKMERQKSHILIDTAAHPAHN